MKSIAMSAFLAALLAGTIAVPAVAAERERGVNARQGMQQHRIRQGVQQGDLTGREARRPQGEARTDRREGRASRADENLSAGERRHFNRNLRGGSRVIRNQRHDGQRRFGYRNDRRRFAYRGNGHAFGRHGTDRRFWGHGANQRFGRHSGHPRFGSQWGHRSSGSSINRMRAQQHRSIARGARSGR